jgi:hypothetical protein
MSSPDAGTCRLTILYRNPFIKEAHIQNRKYYASQYKKIAEQFAHSWK